MYCIPYTLNSWQFKVEQPSAASKRLSNTRSRTSSGHSAGRETDSCLLGLRHREAEMNRNEQRRMQHLWMRELYFLVGSWKPEISKKNSNLMPGCGMLWENHHESHPISFDFPADSPPSSLPVCGIGQAMRPSPCPKRSPRRRRQRHRRHRRHQPHWHRRQVLW